MKITILTALIAVGNLFSCQNKSTVQAQTTTPTQEVSTIINPDGKTISTRINPPEGYNRTTESQDSYAHYLHSLPLKPDGAPVLHYDGTTKPHSGIYCAVVDQQIGKRDLHQCADAVMRTRAEYLWTNKRYEDIHFNFTNGFRVDYSEYMKGRRMIVQGNTTRWNDRDSPSNTYADFWKYMELIFTYAGTASLEKELTPRPILDMQIGDVFIQGGHPGHAIIVVDMAINPTNGKKAYLLAQSYMPAQDLQVLLNPLKTNDPWYDLSESDVITTPEWPFYAKDLMRF